MTARDHEARTAEITDCDPLDATTLHKARLTVACNSATPEEAAETMRMLGIHPDQADEESYATRAPNLPNTAGSHAVHPLSSPNQLRAAPPRVLRAPPDLRAGDFGKSTRMLNDPKGRRV